MQSKICDGALSLPEVERELLRTLIEDGSAEAASLGITEADFTIPAYASIFGMILRADGTADFATLYEPCETAGISDALFAVIQHTTFSSCSVRDYAARILDASRRRELVRLCEETVRHAVSSDHSISDTLSGFQNGVDALAARSIQSQTVSISEAVRRYNAATFGANAKPPVPTGFPALDEILCGGFVGSELVLLGGLTGGGKSTFALHIAVHAAMRGLRVLMLSTEMAPEESIKRLSVLEAYTPFKRCLTSSQLRRRTLSTEDRAELQKTQERLVRNLDSNLFFVDGRISTQALRREALNMKRTGGIDLFVVDYLQQMRSGDARTDREEYTRLNAVSHALKDLTTELRCPVLAAVQFSREANKADRPMIHHLRGSGQLEQDANMILTIHQPSAVKPDDAEAIQCAKNCRAHGYRYLQLFVDKGRDVAPGSVLHFAFDGEHNQIFDAHTNFNAEEQRLA